jgi:hypothetical protein
MSMGLMPIAWHKVNRDNQTKHVTALYEKFAQAKREWLQAEHDLEVLEAQLERAEKEGRPAFDADLYNVKRKQS